MDLLETYQKSVWVIKYLKRHPRGGVDSYGVNVDEISRALRVKRSDIYPALDYLIKEGYVARPKQSDDGLFRLTYKALTNYKILVFAALSSFGVKELSRSY